MLILQRQALENEYRNLQVQEATEGDSTRENLLRLVR